MAEIQLPPWTASGVHPPQPGIVYSRPTWDAAWTQQPYLYPVSALLAAAPTLSKATLVYHFGEILQADRTAFSEFWPPDLAEGHFIRLAVPSIHADEPVDLGWYGVLVGHEVASIGPFNSASSAVAQGDVLYTAYGLEYLLDTVRLTAGHAWEDTRGAQTLGVLPAFNHRYSRGGSMLGNRSHAEDSGAYTFSTDGDLWTVTQIITYLLRYHAPTLPGCTWRLEGQTAILTQMEDVYDLDGLTLRQALNVLIDRRRGLVWSLRTTGTDIAVHVSSVFDKTECAGTVLLDGNREVVRLELHVEDSPAAPLVAAVNLGATSAQLYGRLEVLGERARACLTLSVSSGRLVETWTAAQETDYMAAVGATDWEKNDQYRARPQFADVFCGFRVPPTWDLTGEGANRAIPKISDRGVVDWSQNGPFWLGDKPFLRVLPLLDPVSAAEESYLRPFAILWDPQSERYVLAHKHGIPHIPPASLELHDRELRFRLDASYNHLFARTQWGILAPANPTEHVMGMADAGDYFDTQTLRVTVAVELDERLRLVETLPNGDPARTLCLHVPEAHLWVIAAGTITGLAGDGSVQMEPASRTIRTDLHRLELVAALAKAWYGRRRQTLRYARREIAPLARPGAIIQAVEQVGTEDPIGTVVTSIQWDFEDGLTTLETGFWDLDFATRAFDQPGRPDASAFARAVTGQAAAAARFAEEF